MVLSSISGDLKGTGMVSVMGKEGAGDESHTHFSRDMCYTLKYYHYHFRGITLCHSSI